MVSSHSQITTVGSSRTRRCVRSALLQGPYWKILTEPSASRSGERSVTGFKLDQCHVTFTLLTGITWRTDRRMTWHFVDQWNGYLHASACHRCLAGLDFNIHRIHNLKIEQRGLIRENPRQFSQEELEIKLRLSVEREQFLTLLVKSLSFTQSLYHRMPWAPLTAAEHRLKGILSSNPFSVIFQWVINRVSHRSPVSVLLQCRRPIQKIVNKTFQVFFVSS